MASTHAAKSASGLTYAGVGVDTAREESGLRSLLSWVRDTMPNRKGLAGEAQLEIGLFANVVAINSTLGIAITTDGVGSKLLVAQMLRKFDTVGIDCVAMNVNDILCVGAEPISMVDAIFMEESNSELLSEIGKGLYEGARRANINIVGGEIAQVAEMIKGARSGYAFDLSGTCIGLVDLDKLIVGQDIRDGDVIVGLESSGVHSNGLTLARKALFERSGYTASDFHEKLDTTIGEELLAPCHIYVSEIMSMIREGLNIKALIHITSDGFLNLVRVQSSVGYVIDSLPEPHPVFELIQSCGNVSDEEMFHTFNMGIGFCVIVDPSDAPRAIDIAQKHGKSARLIGYATPDPRRQVRITQHKLIGFDGKFSKQNH